MASCGWMGKGGAAPQAKVTEERSERTSWLEKITPDLLDIPDISLASLLPGPKIKIVQPRDKDLKELRTGAELAKTHRRKSFSDFFMFPEKLYFEEADFPAPGAEVDGSLLPPPVQ